MADTSIGADTPSGLAPSSWQIGLSVISSDPPAAEAPKRASKTTPSPSHHLRHHGHYVHHPQQQHVGRGVPSSTAATPLGSSTTAGLYPGRFAPSECVHLFVSDETGLMDAPEPDGNNAVLLVSKSSSTDSEAGLESAASTHYLLAADKADELRRKYGRLHPRDESPSSFSAHHRPLRRYSPRPSRLTTAAAYYRFVRWNWPAIRLGCFLALLSSMVATTCVIVGFLVAGPTDCDASGRGVGDAKAWWRGSVMYEVFPASFQDTDGDGFGDLRGLLRRIEYVRDLNVAAVRLNSIFSALDYPFRYEHVIDFKNVDPHVGKLSDFEELLAELHRNAIRLVLDINPTITSDQHHWAAHWLLNRTGDYSNFYVNGSDKQADQEESSDVVEAHLSFGGQLHLNWSNPRVQAEMEDVLGFWLSLGVDGFYLQRLEDIRVDADRHLLPILARWRRLLGPRRPLICSDAFVRRLQRLGRDSALLADTVDLLHVRMPVVADGVQLASLVQEVDRTWSPPWTILWSVGDARVSRFADRVGGPEYNVAVLFLLMMLPGSVSLFYGDEIGMRNAVDVATHKVYRSGQLGPMQWSPYTTQAGFTSSASPWLPVHPDFQAVNVANRSDAVSAVRRASALRAALATDKRPAYRVVHADPSVLVIERFHPKKPALVMCANFGRRPERRDIAGPAKILVASSSGGSSWIDSDQRVVLQSGEAFIGEAVAQPS